MKTIMIIEDELTIRELLAELFEFEGYSVMNAANGLEAMDALKISIPDIILMDVVMPIMDGISFRKEQLKNSVWSSIPTIAMSAQEYRKEQLAVFGVNHFLTKPLQVEQLLNTVNSVAYEKNYEAFFVPGLEQSRYE